MKGKPSTKRGYVLSLANPSISFKFIFILKGYFGKAVEETSNSGSHGSANPGFFRMVDPC